MKNNTALLRLLALVVVAVCAFLTLFNIQQNYKSVEEMGYVAQWPVKVVREHDWIPSDYLRVDFVAAKAKWDEAKLPKIGDNVYIKIGLQRNDIAYIKGASDKLPVRDKYIMGQVKDIKDGQIEFALPTSRVRVDVDKVNPQFYSPEYKGILLASLKVKEGEFVVETVSSKGISIQTAQPEEGIKIAEDPEELLKQHLKSDKDSKDKLKI